ncbi:acyltransferase [Atlantibacter sp.]|uniref:acyltransferase family protein n=1 Tax=Atlantibacter sp. TaxID=1903473 RepID=UPI0028ACAFD1|nr:acyltransferase [Atlantibacter sp.]
MIINRSFFSFTSFENALFLKKDVFSFIRLSAAVMVLYAHAYHIYGLGADPLTRIFGVYTGTVAVYIFFTISGFFITQSAMQRNFYQFTIARLSRIYPALIVANIITVIIIIPLSNNVNFFSFVFSDEVKEFIKINSTLQTVKFTITNIYIQHPDQAINGSLWTLPVEIRAYIMALLLVMFGVSSNLVKFNAFFFLAIVLNQIFPDFLLTLFPIPGAVNLIFFFLIGSALFINKKYIPLSPALTFLLIICLILFKGSFSPLVLSFLVSYIIIALGFSLGNCKFLIFKQDYSYGLYLYAYPVSQLAYMHFHVLGFSYYIIAICIISLLFAFISWHCIEQPMNVFVRAKIFPLIKTLYSRYHLNES